MFDTVHRKKDIFDKRPEDHPQYPEEWRIFWEKRYQEIQSQGKNPDQYDYKPDWIPYWAKKVEDLYQNEIKRQNELFLHSFKMSPKYLKIFLRISWKPDPQMETRG